MRLDYFSIWGYLSVALWMTVPVLMAIHMKKRPRRWWVHYALAAALLGYLFAAINSVTHVDQIQPDQSAALAAVEAERKAAAEAVEAVRSGDAAQVSFAEDTHADKLDKGGMDDADLKYMEKIGSSTEPAWKKQKKQRATGKDDDSLDAMVGSGDDAGSGMPDASDAVSEKEPLVMPEKDVNLANRLDMLNLLIVRLLVLAALLMLVIDYLRRFNVYSEAYLPLPLPSEWINAVSPLPPVVARPVPPRRSVKEDLEWIIRRGDSFVYMGRDAASADTIPSSFMKFGRKFCPVEVIRVSASSVNITDVFVFEALWYGRASFVVDSPDRAIQMLGGFMALMTERKPFSARAAHTIHIVWDCGMPLDSAWQEEFAKFTQATGMTLVICPA